MTKGTAAVMPHVARRTAKYLAAAMALTVVFGFAAASQAATRIATLIVIPPAKMPPLPSHETAPVEAPAAAAPHDPSLRLQILHDPQGTGLAMYGALDGEAESATGAVLSLLARSEPFDPTPVSQLLLADRSDRHAQALFIAMMHGAPVVGVAIAALGDPGREVAVLYDDADTFTASFPRLQQALAPGTTVEIGISDNSVYEADTTAGGNADANWEKAIAFLTQGGEARIDAALARSLIDKLASDTGEPWQIVQPASFR